MEFLVVAIVGSPIVIAISWRFALAFMGSALDQLWRFVESSSPFRSTSRTTNVSAAPSGRTLLANGVLLGRRKRSGKPDRQDHACEGHNRDRVTDNGRHKNLDEHRANCAGRQRGADGQCRGIRCQIIATSQKTTTPPTSSAPAWLCGHRSCVAARNMLMWPFLTRTPSHTPNHSWPSWNPSALAATDVKPTAAHRTLG